MAIKWSTSTNITVMAAHDANGAWFAALGVIGTYTTHPVISWAYALKSTGEIAVIGIIKGSDHEYSLAPLEANFLGYMQAGDTHFD